MTARWKHKGVYYTRTNFPITLAWAITLYTSQGMTLNFVYYDPDNREYGIGSTQVGVSRTKTSKHLIIKDVPQSRWYSIKNHKQLSLRITEEKVLIQKSNVTLPKYKKIFKQWLKNNNISTNHYTTMVTIINYNNHLHII